MKKDVLIVFENRAREIENACLLATELEYRGYSVSIRHIESLKKYFIKAKVVLTPHLYNNFHVLVHAKNFWKSHRNLVSLQYEQVYSQVASNDIEDIHNPREEALYAQHVAWGRIQTERYLSCGVPSSNIHEIGSMAMDLMQPEFCDYFLSKNDLSKKFGLNTKSKWAFFISSFGYANRTEKEIQALELLNPYAREFSQLSERSLKEITEWFSAACETHRNIEFIYRPHPAEQNYDGLTIMEQKYKNFHVIKSFSVRQWIFVSDLLFTWYSTSIADAFFANKPCFILRPYIVPQKLEVDIMSGSDFVMSKDDFLSILSEDRRIPKIDVKKIENYYGKNSAKRAYLQLVDLCEKMINSDMGYDFNRSFAGGAYDILNEGKFKKILKTYFWHIMCDISCFCKLSCLFPSNSMKRTMQRFEKECYGINKEIKQLKERLIPVIKSLHKQ